MGGAEEATGASRQTGEGQETEDVGGGVEGDQGSHEEKVGGVPEGQENCGVIDTTVSRIAGIRGAATQGITEWSH